MTWTLHGGRITEVRAHKTKAEALERPGGGSRRCREHVEAFNRAVHAFDRQDFEAMLEELDAAVEWHDAVPMTLGGKATVYRGHEGVRDLWRDLYDIFEERRVEFA